MTLGGVDFTKYALSSIGGGGGGYNKLSCWNIGSLV